LTAQEFTALLDFRTTLRRFLRWSEDQARSVGLTPAQHQLLLVIKGFTGDNAPTIGDVSEHLLLRHHSAVELVDRAESAGFVQRCRDDADGRVVRLQLTLRGERRIERLTRSHLEELARLRAALAAPVRNASHPLDPTN
jgi:DNA-binding MarR family transcriptional regulator